MTIADQQIGMQCDRCKATVMRVMSGNEKIERFMAASDDNAGVDHKKRCIGTMRPWVYESARSF